MAIFKKVVSAVSATALTMSFVAPVSAYSQAEVEAANALAAAGVINDQSANPANYNLDSEITRREMAKVMMNLSGKTVSDTCEGTFADLDSSDWGCKYAEAALAAEFVAANPTFRANDNISKWETLKFILKAKGLEKATGVEPFQAAYVQAAVDAGIISSAFTDYDTAAKRGFIFVAGSNTLDTAVVEEEDDFDLSDIFGEDDTETTDNETVDNTDNETSNEETTNNESNVEGDMLQVELNPNSPENGDRAPISTPRVTFLTFDVAAGNEDVTLDTAVIDATGFGASENIDDVVIYNENGDKVSRQRSVSKSDQNVELAFIDSFTVKAGSVETLIVAATLTGAANGEVYGLTVSELSASSSVEGLPVVGAELEATTISNQGQLAFTADKATQEVEVGEDSKLAGFKVKNDNDKEDITIKSIRVKQIGTVDEDNIDGVYVNVDGEKLVEDITFDNEFLNINFGEGYTLPKDKSSFVFFEVRGVVLGEPGDTVQFEIEETDDFYALGEKNGFNAPVTGLTAGIDISDALAVEGSEITADFIRGEKDATNQDADDFSFGTLKLVSNSGNYVLEDFSILFTVENAGGVTAADLPENIKLGGIASENELSALKATDGSQDLTFGGNANVQTANKMFYEVDFKDITLSQGDVNELELVADIQKNAQDGTKYIFDLSFANGEFKLEDEDNSKTYTTVTGGTINAKDVFSSYSGFTTRNVDVEQAKIEITNSNIDNEEVVLGNVIKKVYTGNIEAGSSADVKVTSIKFTNVATNKVADLEAVVAKAMLTIGTDIYESTDITTTEVKFNTLSRVVKAGSSNKENFELSIQFKDADDSAIAGGLDEIELEINANGDVEAEDNEAGKTATVDAADDKSTTVTLFTSGTLKVDVDVTKNDSSEENDLQYEDRFALAGTNNVILAKLEIDAENEPAELTDITFTTSDKTTNAAAKSIDDSLENIRIVKENKSTVLATASATINSVGGEFVEVEFEDIENLEIGTDDKEVYYLMADVKKIDLDSTASANAGSVLDFSIKTGTVKAEGVSSNKDITGGSLTVATTTAKNVTIIAADVASIELNKLSNTPANGSFIDIAELVVTPKASSNIDDNDDAIKSILNTVVFRNSDLAVSGITGTPTFTLGLREKDSAAVTMTATESASKYTFANISNVIGENAEIDGTTTFVVSLQVTGATAVDADSKATLKLLRDDNVSFLDGSQTLIASAATTTQGVAAVAATGASATTGDLLATADAAGVAANGYTVTLVANNALNAVPNVTAETASAITIEFDGDSNAATFNDIVTTLNAGGTFGATLSSPANGGDTVVTGDAQTITLAGGTAGTAEVSTITFNGTVETAGNVAYVLNGGSTNLAVTAGQTAAQVATALQAAGAAGYTVTVSGNVVTYTATTAGADTDTTVSVPGTVTFNKVYATGAEQTAN